MRNTSNSFQQHTWGKSELLRSWGLNEVLIHLRPEAYHSLTREASPPPPPGHCSSQALGAGVPRGGLVLQETHLPSDGGRPGEKKPHPTAMCKRGRR